MRSYLMVLLVLSAVQIAHCVVYGWLLSLPAADADNSPPIKDPRYNATARDFKVVQYECRKDKHCGKGRYCHRHYGTCHDLKPIGAHCRRDHVCSAGLECVFGRCRKAITHGLEAARCKRDKECNAGLCCAPTHGEWICKRMLRENEICSVPEGGLAYMLNHSCPCGEGFVCSKIRNLHRKRRPQRRKERRCRFRVL